ncbi:phosphate signaling complex protein PhoU, partial [Marivivens donghaensis]|uniref:phosphate signaling complex protein PhoU n=1 Tax=Marivivens donghaensis TaxID=1699413 RepID=UPI003F69E654
MSDQHILSAYDRDLEAIQALVMKMGGLVEAAILDGAQSLETRDVELAAKVRANDKAIDELELRINEEAARCIALRAPVSKDLRTVLTTLKLAGSLERIGDYAKNMAKRTNVLVEMREIPGPDASLRRMAREVEGMLRDVLDAYIQRDVKLAEQVR